MQDEPTQPPQVPAAPQPEPQFVAQALRDELTNANKRLADSAENRIYLLACLHQLQAEFRDAQAMWALERESLVADKKQTD